MPQQKPPAGYAVVQLDDNQWYPLRIARTYGPDLPEDGDPYLSILDYPVPQRYPRRDQALAYCHEQARVKERNEQQRWTGNAAQQEWDQQRGRIPYYLDVIKQVTGKSPTVHIWSDGTIDVGGHIYTCAACKERDIIPYITASTGTLEEIFAQIAEQVYDEHGCCAEDIHYQQAS